jgi:glutamate racemase
VIATPATANSHAYAQAVSEADPSADVWEIGCPEFVPLIESNRIYEPYTQKVAAGYLEPLLANQIDALIYGCTHYPHLEPVLRQLLPSSVTLVDPADHLIAAAAQELDLLGLRNTQTESLTRFCVSGCPQQFAQSSSQWLGYTPIVEQITLSTCPSLSLERAE